MYPVFNIPNNCSKASVVVKVGLEVGRVLGPPRSVELKWCQNYYFKLKKHALSKYIEPNKSKFNK